MRAIVALAGKDLRILFRVRAGLFFSFVWPIIVAILFGVVFGGQSNGPPAVRVALVDEDGTGGSRQFIERLEASGDFAVDRASRADAEQLVQRGQRSAYVVLKPGFAASVQRLMLGESVPIEIGSDPARAIEAAMIEGPMTKQVMSPLTASLGGGSAWEPIAVTRTRVARERRGPANSFEITFPQGIVWGIIGCVMTFAIGLVSERVHGTFVRLQMAPLTRAQILGGKALACFAAITILQVLLLAVGVAFFNVRPAAPGLLLLACASAAVGFVGFMMMIASLGKTEQAVSGAGWAMLMPMAMFGGAMMPQFVMPPWMQTAGNISPVKWAILAMEGAVWRGFTVTDMLLPCAILLGFGAVCFVIGTNGLREGSQNQ